MSLRDLLRPFERMGLLDPIGGWLSTRVNSLIGAGSRKSLLSGTWLGHPLHPVLSDVPIGLFTAATLLDILGGEDGAGACDALTAVGLLSVAPTAAAGASDWADTVGVEQRLGLVHGLANAGSSVLFAAALLCRRDGNRRTGRLFGAAGMAALAASGYIGGHLVYARGVGVDHTVFDAPPLEWIRVAREVDVAADTPGLASANGYGILLYKHSGVIHAIADRCSHAGGPLHEGSVDEALCVTCPWHGSRFRLVDGSVATGPATAGQPAFAVRVHEGHIEVRQREV